jgi:hypothetical protein
MSFWIAGGFMRGIGVGVKVILVAGFLVAGGAGVRAQSQPDSQAGAQLGEQSALGGKQAQGANTQKTTEAEPSGATSFNAGTVIPVELAGSLDSKKAKQGETVNARTIDTLKSTDGRIVIPKGTKVIGHVTQAAARSGKEGESTLGLAFDKATLKSGQDIALNVEIRAVGAPAGATAGPGDTSQGPDAAPMGGGTMPGSGPGSTGGTRGTTGTMNTPRAGMPTGSTADNGVNPGPGNESGQSSGGALTSESRGVVGLNNLTLKAEGAGQGAVITSTGKSVHLDGGTRFILVTQAGATK